MIRIYIVDDEILAINYFKELIRNCKIECQLAGYLTNSILALEQIMELKPDVLFVDINMPGINGIELSKALLENGCNPRIIFLTSYKDFSFIQEGLKLGIDAYILKNELTQETLEEELKKAAKKLQKEKKLRKVEMQQVMKQYLQQAEIEFPKEAVRLKEKEKLWMIYVVCKEGFNVYGTREAVKEINVNELAEKLEAEYMFFGIKDYSWCGICKLSASASEVKKNQIIDVVSAYFKDNGLEVIIVSTPEAGDMKELPVFFQAALRINHYRLFWGERLYVQLSELQQREGMENDFSNYELRLNTAIKKENKKEEHEVIREYLSLLKAQANDAVFIKNAQIIFGIYDKDMYRKNYRRMSGEETNVCFRSCDAFIKWVLHLSAEYYSMKMRGIRKGYSYKVVAALEYIKEHYFEDSLSTGNIAEITKTSEGYLRKIFKEEVGETLADYLNNFRIERAKEILMDRNIRISDVYMKVGFTSSQYFSTVFKKITNYSPKEFQNNHARKGYE